MTNYEKAKLLILENIDMMDYFGNCPNYIIDLAEETLGIKYPRIIVILFIILELVILDLRKFMVFLERIF